MGRLRGTIFTVMSRASRCRSVLLACAVAAGFGTPAHAAGATACPTGLVPAYVHPAQTATWDRLLATTRPGSFVIINPASGPGTAADPAYAATVDRARAAGLRVLGYVPTTWGRRSSSSVKADVDRYGRWYGVTSIFFDEAATSAAALSYYRTLHRRVKSAGGVVVLNHGVPPAQGYMDVSDVVVTFEGDASAYAAATSPSWTSGYGSARFGHLVYGTPAERVDEVLAAARAHRAGRVFVTDDVLANPWDTLPAHYEELQAKLGEGCGS